MPKTISELEAQRAKILQEIESKAGKIPGNQESNQNPSLNDWLNAAEQVMPGDTASPNQQDKAGSYSSKILKTSHSNTAVSTPFFTIIILLTLFLTLVGIIYIAYNTLNNQISEVATYKEESTKQINGIQDGLKSVQQSIASGGKSELFIKMEKQVADLKQEVSALKQKVAKLESQISQQDSQANNSSSATTTKESVSTAPVTTSSNPEKLVTEAVLDEKLRLYYQQLEKNLDQKIEKVIKHLGGDTQIISKPTETLSVKPKWANVDKKQEVATPTVETPVVTEPSLKTVENVVAPTAPVMPEAPKVNMSADVKWLMEQPETHYVLQLASMPNEASTKRLQDKNKLDEAKIIPQTRDGVTSYILVTASLESKREAQKLAGTIKSETGISPWIRQVKDITRRVK